MDPVTSAVGSDSSPGACPHSTVTTTPAPMCSDTGGEDCGEDGYPERGRTRVWSDRRVRTRRTETALPESRTRPDLTREGSNGVYGGCCRTGDGIVLSVGRTRAWGRDVRLVRVTGDFASPTTSVNVCLDSASPTQWTGSSVCTLTPVSQSPVRKV